MFMQFGVRLGGEPDRRQVCRAGSFFFYSYFSLERSAALLCRESEYQTDQITIQPSRIIELPGIIHACV